MVQDRLLELFACPSCGAELGPGGDGGDGGDVCCTNGHRFPVRDGYLDLSNGAVDDVTSRTFESFGYEWNAFDDVRDEDAQFAEVYFRDIDLPALHGKTGLDAGCGKGRYTRFLAPHLAGLVALDGSSAVRAAARNLAPFPNVMVVRADLRAASIRAASVDVVVCLGVLHHLDDPQDGFRRLVRLLAPGGTILVYLYSRPERFGVRWLALFASSLLRRVTVRLPHRALKTLSVAVAALLYAGVVLPGVLGARFDVGVLDGLPMASYRGKPFRSLHLDTFDRLSAPVEHRYVWAELAPWFDDAGLQVLAAREQAGWFVVARRPDNQSP